MTEQHGGNNHSMDGEPNWHHPYSHHDESESNDNGYYKHHNGEESGWGYASKANDESPSDPSGYGQYGESSAAYPKPAYIPYGMPKAKKKKKKHYHPGYVTPAHTPAQQQWQPQCPPMVCDPQYVIRDCCIPREVPVVHPVVTINRHIIVNVPRHYHQPMTQNIVVDPGCPR